MRLEIYDVTGKRIRTLVNGTHAAGTYDVLWDGQSDSQLSVASGIYFYTLHAGEFITTRAMLYVR